MLLTTPNRFVCARQLKSVRKQFNEYGTMKRTLLYMTSTLASYVVFFLLADDYVWSDELVSSVSVRFLASSCGFDMFLEGMT